METAATNHAMVNPNHNDVDLFNTVLDNIERINQIREQTIVAIYNISDPVLRSTAKFTLEMKHEPASKF